MTRKEKKELIGRLHQAITKMHREMDSINKSLWANPGCPLYAKIFELQDVAVSSTALLIGDKAHWLDWFAFENDWGKKEYEAGRTGKLKKIKTVDDLLDLIDGDA